jgi:hypothetical protein
MPPLQSLLELAKDGFLARYLAGGRSREEIRAVARDGPAEDTPESLRRGWQRMSLLVLYFNPSGGLAFGASSAYRPPWATLRSAEFSACGQLPVHAWGRCCHQLHACLALAQACVSPVPVHTAVLTVP